MSDPLQILVVEDEKAVGHMIAMVLGGPASKVARARSGWEALIKIGAAARPFDVVITDHRMPRMTGLQLVRRIGSQRGSQPRLARCESLRPCLFERQIPRRLLCERLES
jgi:CheY-like chemotaxis protein